MELGLARVRVSRFLERDLLGLEGGPLGWRDLDLHDLPGRAGMALLHRLAGPPRATLEPT